MTHFHMKLPWFFLFFFYVGRNRFIIKGVQQNNLLSRSPNYGGTFVSSAKCSGNKNISLRIYILFIYLIAEYLQIQYYMSVSAVLVFKVNIPFLLKQKNRTAFPVVTMVT